MSGDLALTRPLLDWLREDPGWAQLPARRRAALAWRAGWGSINARLGAALGAQAAGEEAPLHDPILIVGPWRSGTTVMHELLSAAMGLAAPQTWQCMNACGFALGAAPRSATAIARPMDGLPIRADSPQEDEFALLTLGVPSAYRAFWMPHRLAELSPTLDPQYWLAAPQWLPVWEGFLRGVLRTLGPAARQPLILKSPNHLFRLPAILRRFPSAQVVWMTRPAAELFESNRRMWQAMFAAHGLSAPDLPALDGFVADALAAAADILHWCAEHLGAAQWALVAHDSLQRDGVAVVHALAERLAWRRSVDAAALDAALVRVASGRVAEVRNVALAPAAAAAVARLDDAQRAVGASFALRPSRDR